MSGSSIGLSFNYGYAGKKSGTPDDITVSKPVKGPTSINFGQPVVLNTDNTFSSPSDVTITAANFAGIAVAEVKQLNTYSVGQDQAQSGYYATNEPADVLERGLVTVKCVHGTPPAGGAVYVRKTLNSSFPAEKIGDLRADADSTNTVQLTNCSWATGLKDANGITELKIKSINN